MNESHDTDQQFILHTQKMQYTCVSDVCGGGGHYKSECERGGEREAMYVYLFTAMFVHLYMYLSIYVST